MQIKIIFSRLVKSNPVKLEISHTVVLPRTESVLYPLGWPTRRYLAKHFYPLLKTEPLVQTASNEVRSTVV